NEREQLGDRNARGVQRDEKRHHEGDRGGSMLEQRTWLVDADQLADVEPHWASSLPRASSASLAARSRGLKGLGMKSFAPASMPASREAPLTPADSRSTGMCLRDGSLRTSRHTSR